MTDTKTIAVAGAAGRMGRELVRAVLMAGHGLSGATEAPDSPARAVDIARLAGDFEALGRRPVSDPVEAANGAQIWIDFTTPEATLAALDALKHTSVRAVVIGTTGFTKAQEARIRAAGAKFAIVKAGNYSLGVNLLTALTRIASARLGSRWDIEILETHHRHKVDAPSGTALMLGEAASQGRGVELSRVRRAPYDGKSAQRDAGEIGFAVRRAGGVVGEHEVMIASETEWIRLGHGALDRSVFAEGAIEAGLWASAQPPGLYDMEDVLGLKGVGLT